MSIETTFLFITFCGLIGIFLRRNLLNIIISFIQVFCGLNGLIKNSDNFLAKQDADYFIIILFSFTIILFIYAVAILLIKRRSTIQVNELTEMRG